MNAVSALSAVNNLVQACGARAEIAVDAPERLQLRLAEGPLEHVVPLLDGIPSLGATVEIEAQTDGSQVLLSSKDGGWAIEEDAAGGQVLFARL